MSIITLEICRNTHANVLSIGVYSYSIGGGGGGAHPCSCNHRMKPNPIMMMANTLSDAFSNSLIVKLLSVYFSYLRYLP